MNQDFNIHILAPATQAATVPPERRDRKGRGTELHSNQILGIFQRESKAPADKILKSWNQINIVLGKMVSDSEKQAQKGFKLTEMEVSLTVSGEGDIMFVSAKAEAGIVLKFTRG